MIRRRIAVSLALALVSVIASADDALEKRLAQKLGAVLQDVAVTSVKPGPIPGLYEVMLGPTVLYMTEDGRFAVRGDVFDLQTKTNLTEQKRSQARLSALQNAGAGAIEFAPESGKPQHVLYVFTDVDCGYCRKMHQQVKQLTDAGIAVRYLAFPRTGLDSESYHKAVTVWCSADRKQALTDAKLGKELPRQECDNPVAAQYELGQAMGVHGTPAVYTEDGTEIGGYLPAADIIRRYAGN
jgi:thiol:disulfide interchange protein DsbC